MPATVQAIIAVWSPSHVFYLGSFSAFQFNEFDLFTHVARLLYTCDIVSMWRHVILISICSEAQCEPQEL